MSTESVKPSPKVEAIAAELRKRVAAGVYPPHSFFPAERDLSVELRVGRPTVRAAIDLLETERLVVQTQGRGTRVLPPMERLRHHVIGIVRARQPHIPRKYEATVAGVEEELLRQGYDFEQVPNVMVADTADPSKPRKLVPTSADMLAERFGALVFVETDEGRDVVLEMERRRVPVVVAGIEIDLPVSATWTDHAKASRNAVQTLAALGHRRIAFVGGPPDFLFYGRAREGYLAGLRQAALPVEESLIAEVRGENALTTYLAVKKWLELPALPTAVVAARDYFANGVCTAFAEAGYAIGRDLSVIGFDDVSWPQEESLLTTFHEPCYEMGSAAAQMLIQRIVMGWQPPERREIEAPFILRRSAGPAPAALIPPLSEIPIPSGREVKTPV